jgi:hypothetical protein
VLKILGTILITLATCFALGLLLSMLGCSTPGQIASPDTDLNTLGNQIGDIALSLQDIGGNGDSIGLWLAIVSLALTGVLGDVAWKRLIRDRKRSKCT